MRLIEKKWVIPADEPEDVTDLPMSKRLLFARGFSDGEEMTAFLSDKKEVRHDPFLLPDMKEACERIIRAIEDKERILIYGDYDADGITATSILTLFLRKINAIVEYMIPDRVTEGYGISEVMIEEIKQLNPKLIVTVDCAVANIDEIAQLSTMGIDVVVTDHHEVKSELPEAVAVVCAKRPDSQYPFSQLCGAGIALKLVQALCELLPGTAHKNTWKEYLDLAAIGTIADVVPLIGENRSIVKEGLALLCQRRRLGIQAIYDLSVQGEEPISSALVSFSLVPKINAAGRMGDAKRAVELLITDDPARAGELSKELVEDNIRRQEIESVILSEAIVQIESGLQMSKTYLECKSPIIVRGKDWHSGIVGIVASRIVSAYHRSAIVLTEQSGQPGMLKGSARAAAGYNILNAILFAQEHVAQYGGHPGAAGITIRNEDYEPFRSKVEEYGRNVIPEVGEPVINIDAVLTPKELSLSTWQELHALEPFGEGNREPRFLVRNAVIADTVSCGKGKHLRYVFGFDVGTGQETACDAIAFGFGYLEDLFRPGDKVDVVFELRSNKWKNKESLSLQVVDIHFVKSGKLLQDAPDILEKLYVNRLPMKQIASLAKVTINEMLPGKEDIKTVYQFIRTRCGEGLCVCDLPLLAGCIRGNYGTQINTFALARIMDIFDEAGLISIISREGVRVCFCLLFVQGKVKLENTNTFRSLFEQGG